MLIATHVIIALAGILASTIAAIFPTMKKIKISAALISLTIATGFILILVTRSHILQTCISGLSYIALTSAILLLAKARLNEN